MTPDVRLQIAWERWDAKMLTMSRRPPPNFGLAEADERIAALKAYFGPGWVQASERLAAARRQGLTYEQALERERGRP
jgi:hypothetical protein